jgi:hypothetical protein
MKVWLDDKCNEDCDRRTPAGWIGCETALQACRLIKRGDVTHISFDHDLGEKSASGYVVACYIEKLAALGKLNGFPEWDVHSSNPTGSAYIKHAMRSAERFFNRLRKT